MRHVDPTIREVRGASRTDAGVHARDQRVSFSAAKAFPSTAWTHGAQRHLPEEISIRAAWSVPSGFDPRGHTKDKTYRYLLLLDEQRDPFLAGRAWRVPELSSPEAFARMNEEVKAAVGEHDFAAFRGASDQRPTTVRNLSRVVLEGDPEAGSVAFVEVTGNAFLFNMVRILVGTIVDVGRGRKAPGAIARALASKDRRDAGITAPPDGLYLERYRLRGEELLGTDAFGTVAER